MSTGWDLSPRGMSMSSPLWPPDSLVPSFPSPNSTLQWVPTAESLIGCIPAQNTLPRPGDLQSLVQEVPLLGTPHSPAHESTPTAPTQLMFTCPQIQTSLGMGFLQGPQSPADSRHSMLVKGMSDQTWFGHSLGLLQPLVPGHLPRCLLDLV